MDYLIVKMLVLLMLSNAPMGPTEAELYRNAWREGYLTAMSQMINNSMCENMEVICR